MLDEKLGSPGPRGDSPDHVKPKIGVLYQRQPSIDHAVGDYRGGCKVEAGFYWDKKEWSINTVSGTQGGVLPKDRAEYTKIPAPAMLVAAPVMGAAYVMFLPFAGMALFADHIGRKTMAAVRKGVRGEMQEARKD